jgi:hypothetical protein
VSDRSIAVVALVVALVALVLLIVHAAIPTPPAHQPNALYSRFAGNNAQVPG